MQTKTLHGRLAQDLQVGIRKGEWPVGSSLPSEKTLAERFGVSRHTLRHALKTLQEQGVIECSQGAPSKVISCTQPRVYSQDFNTMKNVLRYPRSIYRENITERHVECDVALQSTMKSPWGTSWLHIGAIRREEQSAVALN